MRRLVKAAAIVAVLSSGRASAAPTPVGATPVVLVAIDSVEVTGTTIVVAGVEEGAGAPSEWSISFYVTSSDTFAMGQLEACHRMALAAMTKPGAYRLTLWDQGSYSYAHCRLSRVTP